MDFASYLVHWQGTVAGEEPVVVKAVPTEVPLMWIPAWPQNSPSPVVWKPASSVR